MSVPTGTPWQRLVSALRGPQTYAHRRWPIGEALHPLVLGAVVLLAVNDWLWKPAWVGRAAPWLTGKLSDVAGLLLAPLVLSALIGVLLDLASRFGAAIDPSLSRRRIAMCVVATGTIFVAVKTSPAIAASIANLWSRVMPGSRIVCDPTDLLALPMLAVAYLIGRGELARVPLGRVDAIRRKNVPAAPALADAVVAGADPAFVRELADAIDRGDEHRVNSLLA